MLTNLATFIHANGRRVLLVAVLAAAIAGAFGVGVAKHMSPYGADDPATQSVQATKRFETAAHRKINPGIVAIVSACVLPSTCAVPSVTPPTRATAVKTRRLVTRRGNHARRGRAGFTCARRNRRSAGAVTGTPSAPRQSAARHCRSNRHPA